MKYSACWFSQATKVTALCPSDITDFLIMSKPYSMSV